MAKPKLTECPLRGPAVYPETRPTDDVFFIGFAPGAEEERVGRPFVGPSGKVGRGWLKTKSLLGRVSFANVELHRTPKNREPTKDEIRFCLPTLQRVLERSQPRIIICAGAVPARAFGFKGPVGRMVGRWKATPWGHATVVYHPAYLLRLRGKPRHAEVEALVMATLDEVVMRLGTPALAPTYAHTFYSGPGLTLTGEIAVDCETSVAEAEPDGRVDRLTLTSIHDGSHTTLVPGQAQVRAAGTPHLVMHNAQYDLCVLGRQGLPLEGITVDDTMIMAWMLGEPVVGLKTLAQRHLSVSVMEWEQVQGTDKFFDYSAQDAVLTWQLREKLRPRLDTSTAAWLYDHVDAPLQPVLARMSLRGLLVDAERCNEMLGTITTRRNRLAELLRGYAGSGYNPNSVPQTLSFLSERLGAKLKSTDADVLEKYRADEVVATLLAYRRVKDLRARYLLPLSRLSVVSCIWNAMGAETGRLSSHSRNLQNLPAGIKTLLVARPGMVFVTRDYSQLELRIAAYLSRDPYLLGALREGRDIHRELSLAVYGQETPELRVKVKGANFERLYGGGLEKRAAILGISPSRAATVGAQWTVYDAWAARTAARAIYEGKARTLQGRIRILWDAKSSDPYLREKANREAGNTAIQGTGSDWTKHAMVIVAPWVRQLGGWVVMNEHDSITVEVPADRAEEADAALALAMRRSIPDEVLQVIDITTSSTVGTHWK